MAEENQESKLPDQEQFVPESTFFPPRAALKTWPELVGLEAEEAERKIKEDMPIAQIQVVPPDHFVTMDFIKQRVRIYVDSSGKVANPPRIG